MKLYKQGFFWLVLLIGACGIKEPVSFENFNQAAAWYRSNSTGDTMTPDSSSIAYATYFARSQRRILLVNFHSNPAKSYIFEGVPKSVWSDWKAAENKGHYFSTKIKGRYRFVLRRPIKSWVANRPRE